jgi:hypothetical protein
MTDLKPYKPDVWEHYKSENVDKNMPVVSDLLKSDNMDEDMPTDSEILKSDNMDKIMPDDSELLKPESVDEVWVHSAIEDMPIISELLKSENEDIQVASDPLKSDKVDKDMPDDSDPLKSENMDENMPWESDLTKSENMDENMPSVSKILESQYMDANMQEAIFSPFGYERDTVLSNDNVAVHYNPTSKRLIYVVAGAHDKLDWLTSAAMFFGLLKYTQRYKEADTSLKTAKIKYGVTSGCDIYGHSLGGSIASLIASKNDTVITYDQFYGKGWSIRDNTTSYRTKGDLVSLYGIKDDRTVTLENPHEFKIQFGGIVKSVLKVRGFV